MYLDNLNLLERGIVIMFLIAMFSGAIYIFTNVIKSKDTICDNEKQSKFILECLKEDKTKTVGAIGNCERISIKLYCK
jgi:hypothetical protein